MAKKVNITGLTVGDDESVYITVQGLVTGETVTKAWFTIKNLVTDTYTNAVVKKVITSALNSDGQITTPGTNNEAIMYFNIPRAETKLLAPNYKYKYDIQVQLNTGNLKTAISPSDIVFGPQVTEVET